MMKKHNQTTSFFMVLVLISIIIMITPPAEASWAYQPGLQWSYSNLGQVLDGKLVEGGRAYLVYGTEGSGNACHSWARLFNSTNGKVLWYIRAKDCNTTFENVDLNSNGRTDLLTYEYGGDWGPMTLNIYLDGGITPVATKEWSGLVSLVGTAVLDKAPGKDLLLSVSTGSIPNGTYSTTLEARSGKDLSLLWSFNPNNYLKVADAVIWWPDMMDTNGDGIDDPLVWVQGNHTSGMLFMTGILLDGKDGQVQWQTRVEDQRGSSVAVPGNATRAPEYVIIWENFTMSGENDYIETIDVHGNSTTNWPVGTLGSCMDLHLEDYNGDGMPELSFEFSSGMDEYNISIRKIDREIIGRITVTSPLYTPALRSTRDITGDGVPELLVLGSSVWIINGKDSSIYKKLAIDPFSDSLDLRPGVIAFYSQSHYTNAQHPGIVRLGLMDLATSQVGWTLPYEERVNDAHLADVDHDGRLELLLTTKNITASETGNGRVLMYGLGEPPANGGGGNGTPPHKYKTGIATGMCFPAGAVLILVAIISVVARNLLSGKDRRRGPKGR